jgi:hypothetical protein
MPEEIEKRLKKIASEKFPGNAEKQRAYVYGTLRKMGWKPESEKAKGDN